jgi:hypothetical protein
MDGYNFALKKLKKGMCVKCLVANSVGPDNHDDGLRDACQDFSRFYYNKQKKDCTKIMTCKH